MEELNLVEKMFLGGLILCWSINLALPVILYLSGVWLSFCKRVPLDNYTWASDYQNMKYKRIFGNRRGADSEVIYLILDIFASTILLWGLGKITENGYLLPIITTTGVIAGLFFIPRFVFDLCKTLKYKPKTGESETIEKLKEDVKTLQKRLDNKQ